MKTQLKGILLLLLATGPLAANTLVTKHKLSQMKHHNFAQTKISTGSSLTTNVEPPGMETAAPHFETPVR